GTCRQAIGIGFEVGEPGRVLHEPEALFARAQFFLDQFALGDVQVRANAANHFAGFVALEPQAAGDPADLSIVGAANAEFASRRIAVPKASFDLRQPLAVVRMNHVDPVVEGERGRAVFGQAHLPEQVRREMRQTIGVGLEIGEAGRFLHEPQTFFAAAECLVRFLAFVDIARDAHVGPGTVGQAERHGMGFDMAAASVQADDLVGPDDAFALDHAPVDVNAVGEIFLGHGDVAGCRQAFEIWGLEQLQTAGVYVDEPPGLVEYFDAIGNGVEDGGQPRLALAKRVLRRDFGRNVFASRDEISVTRFAVLDGICVLFPHEGGNGVGAGFELELDR